MEKEIKLPGFINYTDCRPAKKDLCGIAEESVRNYARNLSTEEMAIFLSEVTDEALVSALHIRLIERESKLKNIGLYFR